MPKFGAGIIGCGIISGSHATAYRMFPDDCSLIAVSDVNEESARKLIGMSDAQWYPDWRDLLADERIHVVSICTPHYLHAPMTIAAAWAGKHVICEKPMAMTVGECYEMIAACKANRVKLSIGSERFNPRHRFIKEKVSPELGAIDFTWIVDFYYRDSAYYAKAPWRGTWSQEGGGVCINQAIYTWDQWQWFLGGVDYAYGYWANILHPSIEVEDIAYGMVKFKNGSYGKLIATSCCEWHPDIAGVRIVGQNGIIWSDDPWMYKLNFSLHDANMDASLHEEFNAAIDLDYKGMFQHWQVSDMFAAIREDRDPIVPDAIEAVKILNGIHWHGWNYSEQFQSWAKKIDLPATIEDAKTQGWQGGKVIQCLLQTVQSQDPWLWAPFMVTR